MNELKLREEIENALWDYMCGESHFHTTKRIMELFRSVGKGADGSASSTGWEDQVVSELRQIHKRMESLVEAVQQQSGSRELGGKNRSVKWHTCWVCNGKGTYKGNNHCDLCDGSGKVPQATASESELIPPNTD